MTRRSWQGDCAGTDKAPATVRSLLAQEEVGLPVCTQNGSTGNKVLSALGIYSFPHNLNAGRC